MQQICLPFRLHQIAVQVLTHWISLCFGADYCWQNMAHWQSGTRCFLNLQSPGRVKGSQDITLLSCFVALIFSESFKGWGARVLSCPASNQPLGWTLGQKTGASWANPLSPAGGTEGNIFQHCPPLKSSLLNTDVTWKGKGNWTLMVFHCYHWINQSQTSILEAKQTGFF